jgi:hypothetical protein
MIGNRVCGIALIAASATICPSAIAASFDGNWSVVAQTTQGHCGSMQFGLAISHGRLYFAGVAKNWRSTAVQCPDDLPTLERNQPYGFVWPLSE